MRCGCLLPGLVALGLLASAPGASSEGRDELRIRGLSLEGQRLEGDDDPRIAALWTEGLRLENRGQLLESSGRYERIAQALPTSATIRWRLARNHWRHGESLPTRDKRGRLHFFGLSKRWAEDGIAVDDSCGECMFWKAAGLGRLATTGGVIEAAGSASTIAKLIERAIELKPTHQDGPRNVTLANLYYAGAGFYRVVPDWWWLPMLIGVRGDRQRALDYIDQAIEITYNRIDYHIERGAVLLCMGTKEGEPARVEQGRAVLREALTIEEFLETDTFDRDHARTLMQDPSKGCGYSRDGWIDLSEAEDAGP